jgi:hypothetical protein
VLVTDCYEPATLLAQFKAAGAPQLAAPRRIIRVNELPALGSGKTDYVAIQLTAEAEAVAGEVKNGSAARRIDDRLRDRYVSSGRRLHRPNHKGRQARRSAGGAATKFEFDPTGKGTTVGAGHAPGDRGRAGFSQDPALEDAARACRCQCRAASNFAA